MEQLSNPTSFYWAWERTDMPKAGADRTLTTDRRHFSELVTSRARGRFLLSRFGSA